MEAAFEGDPAARTREEVIVAYPFIEAIAVHRMAHVLHGHGVPLLPRIMSGPSRTGMDIHPGATIWIPLFVDHCTGTVIGETFHPGQPHEAVPGRWAGRASLAAGQALQKPNGIPPWRTGLPSTPTPPLWEATR